ncbi:hypothetical protein [Phaeodactylibacter sp.]|uniref:hypothetical protein n=1 Tax=Phaeodactylibacter sp. TaxID=1940289 RepID=UPI0032EC9EAA
MEKHLFLLSVIWSFILPNSSFAQKEPSAGLRLQVHAPVVHWLQFGQGSGAAAWVALPLSTQSSLEFSLGYQHFSGYQRGLVTINEIINPYEYWRHTESLELNGMTFFSATLSHEYRLTDSRWSVGTGIRFSRLISSEGYQQSHERYRVYRISTDPFANSLNVDIDQNYQTRARTGFAYTLNEEQLNLYDLGLTIALRYRLIKGLVAETRIYQGLLNRWSNNYNDLEALHITSFSLGLSARIF